MDYIIPDFLAKLLRKPSQRTQLEASIVGILFIMTASIGISIYMIFFTKISIYYKIFSGIGGIGVFLLLGSNLVTTYLQYYYLKVNLNLYPPNEKLIMKIDEAKLLIKELNDIIKEVKDVV